MKIKEAIKILEKIKSKHGNRNICIVINNKSFYNFNVKYYPVFDTVGIKKT